jgi:predicted permease
MLPIISFITIIHYTTFLVTYRRRRGTTKPLSWFSSVYALVFSSVMAAAYVTGIVFVVINLQEDSADDGTEWLKLTSTQKALSALQIIGAIAQVGILAALFGYGLRVRREMKKGASFMENLGGDVEV